LIGSYVCEKLLQRGAVVRVADSLERGREEHLAGCAGPIEFFKVDLRHLRVCRTVTRNTDVVFHMAARTAGVAYSQAHHGELFTSTLSVSLNVLQAAVENGVKRVLLVSSSCVYPDNASSPIAEAEGTVNGPEKVNEGYGWAKRMGESQALYFQKEHDLEVAIARPTNIYGPRYPFDLPEPHVIPAITLRVLRGEDPLHVWGSGQQKRSFMHASDAAEAMLRITEHYAVAKPVNVSNTSEIPIGDLARMILQLSGNGHRQIIFETNRPEGAPHKTVDLTRFRAATNGFEPTVSLEEGLKEVIVAADRYLAEERKGRARRVGTHARKNRGTGASEDAG
jgi:nucleoside-diphosphate-sugar epimerase